MRSLLEDKAGTDRTIGTTSNACRLVLFTSSNTEDAIQGTEGDKGSQKRNDSDQAHPTNRAMQDSDQRKEPKRKDDSDATINGTNISFHGNPSRHRDYRGVFFLSVTKVTKPAVALRIRVKPDD